MRTLLLVTILASINLIKLEYVYAEPSELSCSDSESPATESELEDLSKTVQENLKFELEEQYGVLKRLLKGQKTLTLNDADKVVQAFKSVSGEDLVRLKKKIDYDRDLPRMETLVFDMIQNTQLRSKLLDYFKSEAEMLKKEEFHKMALASDIDDTVYPSQYDRHPKEEIAEITDENGAYVNLEKFHKKFDHLVFVTARPYSKSNFKKTHDQLDALGVEPKRSISMGKLWKIWQNKTRVKRKVASLERVTLIYPEYEFIWIGDNGEGDLDTGVKIAAKRPEQVSKILIHRINKPTHFKQRFVDRVQGIKNRKESNHEKVYFFDNYAEALEHLN